MQARTYLTWSVLILATLGVAQSQTPPPDPATDTLYPYSNKGCFKVGPSGEPELVAIDCSVFEKQVIVYWPAMTPSSPPPGLHSLVLVFHGNGFSVSAYDNISHHLARNGFIVASTTLRDDSARDRVRFLRESWEHHDHVRNRLAIVGHSRGGEDAVVAARRFATEWATDAVNVEAVVGIAPTDQDNEVLMGTHTRSFLVLYGSRDNDVKGYCLEGDLLVSPSCGNIPSSLVGNSFSLYDRAGSESSVPHFPFFPDARVVTKAMVFVDRANHANFSDSCSIGPGLIDCNEQHAVTAAYVNAFLRWRVENEGKYRHFFTGEWRSESLEDLTIRTQYRQGTGRKVVDNFDQPGWGSATLGTVDKETQIAIEKEGSMWDFPNYTIPHDTRGLMLRWKTLPFLIDPWIRWSIPDGESLELGRYRDVTDYTHLSFRAGIVFDAPLNLGLSSLSFDVQLRDANGSRSHKIPIWLFNELSYPDDGFVVTSFPQNGSGITPKSSMQTVRIPLKHYFSDIDLENVASVELRFGDNDSTQGEVVIDNLEFVAFGGDVLGTVPSPLADNLPTFEMEADTGDQKIFFFDLPHDVAWFEVETTGGTGDVDLYVQPGQPASPSNWRCRPYEWGNDEACLLNTQGNERWFITLDAYDEFSDVTLIAKFGKAPCTQCDYYPGTLEATGDRDFQPDGTYYWSPAGSHQGFLLGDSDTDFDLYLYRWSGNGWYRVAGSESPDSEEQVDYQGSAGYYYWSIDAYSGGGNYSFWLDTP